MGIRPVAAPPAEPAAAHVRVVGDALAIDGRPTFLFGGELQYYRVRAPDFDAARTHALWAEKLDRLRDLGANLLTTYVPWDYHELAPGRFDFTGARDLPRFLALAADRGFFIVVRPGPFILSEWPYGVGSYGAIPLWWKRANRGELVRERSGRAFHWHLLFPPLGRFRNAQPSYASQAFLEATGRWFAAVAPIFRPFMGPGRPIVALQIDNETNLFWSDAYTIDFHPAALARYHERLRERYRTVGGLSRAYARRYSRFEDVRPPARRGTGPRHRDWFDHQHALVGEYLAALRALWLGQGFREPDLLFLTNDTFQTFPTRDLVLPNGVVKNSVGLHALDCYPRCYPVPHARLFDKPYEMDVAAKLLDRYNDLYLGPSRFSMGIEVQGGHFATKVSPEATRQTLLRLVAHGVKAIGVYVVAGGLNFDGSRYDFEAAIPYDGSASERAPVLAAVARLLRENEPALLESRAVESPVALLVSARMLAAGYGLAGEQRIFGDELRALFGWLANAGLNPEIEDLGLAQAADLRRFRAIVFPCSGAISEEEAAKLEAFVEAGGTLVQLFEPGPLAHTLFPHGRAAAPFFTPGRARFAVDGLYGEIPADLRSAPRLLPPADAATVLEAQGALGYARPHGRGRAIFLACSPAGVFSRSEYFVAEDAGLEARALFARRLFRAAGVRRILACGEPREEAHARLVRSSGESFWFVFSGHDAGRVTVRARGLAALGIGAGERWVVEEVFGDRRRGPWAASGAALREEGIALDLERYGATVLRARREA